MRDLSLVSILLLAAVVMSAQEIPAPPRDAVTLGSSLRSGAQSTVLSWIAKQATSATGSKTDAATLDASLRTTIGSRFTGQSVSSTQVDALVMLVMIETVNGSIVDARSTLARLAVVRAEKAKLRDVHTRLKQIVDSTASLKSSEPCRATPCTQLRTTLSQLNASQTEADIPSPVVPRDAVTLGELRVALMELDAELDSIDELDEDTALRLQALVERIAKLNAALSVLMKRVASAQSTVISNLK